MHHTASAIHMGEHKRGAPGSALGTSGMQIRGAFEEEVAEEINLEREAGMSQEKAVLKWGARRGGRKHSPGRETETERGRGHKGC